MSLYDPLPTIDTNNRFGVAVPFLADTAHGGSASGRLHDVNAPLPTQTTKRSQAMLFPFLVKYFGTAKYQSVSEPLGTLTTKDRYGLALVKVMEKYGIVDIGFRMLQNGELAAATGFPDDYLFGGGKADVTKQIGNAIPPVLISAIVRSLHEATFQARGKRKAKVA